MMDFMFERDDIDANIRWLDNVVFGLTGTICLFDCMYMLIECAC